MQGIDLRNVQQMGIDEQYGDKLRANTNHLRMLFGVSVVVLVLLAWLFIS